MMPLHTQQNSWVDEFLDYYAMRWRMHQRTTSDPVTFVEVLPFIKELGNNNCFERMDDEQLRDMFSDYMADTGPMTRSSTNPLSPSEQNGENIEKKTVAEPKNEPGEVNSSCKSLVETQPPAKSFDGASGDTIADPKRIKR
ncbi:Hypothetical predicted protein [Olea europaea subsp. europaea]|uniref:Uncharacterized protein n=1 Tax=Olea europaea subsp. europaea TaxID=158383 RepID=A0A8S0RBR7_OLEEU|nr:Hypothetical predicted protein [Olea europaea subsp. europaea]